MTTVTYVLLIAIERYNQRKSFGTVRYARKDCLELQSALLGLGVDTSNVIMLLDSTATKTAIETEINIISRKALPENRIIIYFAGHGSFIDGENFLIPFDAYKESLKSTCISINYILGSLKKSACKKSVIFLDSCHSGFEPGDDSREIDQNFMADELLMKYRDETYCVGFASCKSDEKSISDIRLQNGIWTHFLITALKGESAKIYERGLLFNDNLQSYLNKSTAEFAKLNTPERYTQTPITFGNQSDRFVIADLNPIFETRERQRKVSEISVTNITLLHQVIFSAKGLPGFKKGYHHVPTYMGPGPNKYIKEWGNPWITDEITDISSQLRTKLKYKLKDIQITTETGSASINTPDFLYSVEIWQSDDDPGDYIYDKHIEDISSYEFAQNEEFNEIFKSHFNYLKFELSRRVDIELLIGKLEELDNDKLTLDYDPSNLDMVSITIEGIDHTINITEDSISFSTGYKTSPQQLIEAYKETQAHLLSFPELNLLE